MPVPRRRLRQSPSEADLELELAAPALGRLQLVEEDEVAAAVDVVPTALVPRDLHVRELDVVHLAGRRHLQQGHLTHEANRSRPRRRRRSRGRSSSHAASTLGRVSMATLRGAYAATANRSASSRAGLAASGISRASRAPNSCGVSPMWLCTPASRESR